jgi:hypothetical protein
VSGRRIPGRNPDHLDGMGRAVKKILLESGELDLEDEDE